MSISFCISNVYHLFALPMETTTKIFISLGLCIPQFGIFILNVQYQTGLIFGSSRFRHVNNILSQLLPDSVSTGHTVLYCPYGGKRQLIQAQANNQEMVAFMMNEIIPPKNRMSEDEFSWSKLLNTLTKTYTTRLIIILLCNLIIENIFQQNCKKKYIYETVID